MVEIVYSCADFAVAVKPYGVLSEYDENRRNMVSELAETLGVAAESVFPVHRLDATTEGLTVYALTKDAAAALSKAVTEGRLHKKYIAFITADDGLAESGEMNDFLFFDRRAQKSFVVDRAKKGAKEARLSYSLGERRDYNGTTVTKAEIELMTGRTHQIRAQFGARRSAIIGDGKYGSRVNYKGAALYSACLSFPFGGEEYAYSIAGRIAFHE